MSLEPLAYVREAPEPEEPPPAFSSCAVAWARANLFSSVGSSFVTIGCIALVGYLLPQLVAWATTRALWSASDGGACRQHQDGACWAFVIAKWDYLRFGSYPVAERWRVDVVEAIGAALIIWLLWINTPRRVWGAFLFFVVYPILTLILLRGTSVLGLPIVDTLLWGGIFVSLLTAVVRLASIVFIEVVRGVPFITILFMANNLLPLFLPEAWAPDRFLRPLAGIVIFSAGYMAEEVRGGLQSLGKGQYEAAMALGLNYSRMTALVVLPQALTLVIPGIVNNFIGLFMDTTLISIVGMTDFLEAMNNAIKDPVWAGPTIMVTGYVFAGIFYFAFCFGMARYSTHVERILAKGGS
jgi:general L-amino acid transport system permease protein